MCIGITIHLLYITQCGKVCTAVVCTVFVHYIIIGTVGYLQPDHVACVSLVYSVSLKRLLKAACVHNFTDLFICAL